MKQLFTAITMIACCFMATIAYAQPANDDCMGAIALTIYSHEDSCVQTQGTTVDATASSTPTDVCSGTWYGDDVWFSFTTGMTAVPAGYTIKLAFDGTGGNISAAGMALYRGCGSGDVSIQCFSDGTGAVDRLVAGLTPNQTYYVRVWSGLSVNDHSGTFDICVFENMVDTNCVWGATEGRFSGGIGEWTTTGISDSNAVWTWDSLASAASGAFAADFQKLSSFSAEDGAMILNSDFYDSDGTSPGTGAVPSPHESVLTSPIIDCSSASEVALVFSQQYRNYQSTTYVEYSIDSGATFTTIQINQDIDRNDRTDLTDLEIVNLPGAGGQDDVVVRFRFSGDYYYWIIDDVKIMDATQIHNTAYVDYLLPYSYSTPVTQADSFFFGGYVSNIGIVPEDNVKLTATVEDASGNVVYQDSVVYAQLAGNTIDSITIIPTPFSTTQTGFYYLTYELSQDNDDFNPIDNITTAFEFEITDSTYQNDNGFISNDIFTPSQNATTGNYPAGYGNVFYVALDQTAYPFVQFLVEDASVVMGKKVNIFLYKLDYNGDGFVDENLDGDFNLDDLTIENDGNAVIGFQEYTFSGNETGLIRVGLDNFTAAGDPITLEADNRYLVMVEYDDDAAIEFPISTEVGFLGNGSDFSQLRTVLYDNDGFYGGGWDGNSMAFVRLRLPAWTVSTSSTGELLNALDIFPNPADKMLTVDVNLEEYADATLTLTDYTGKVLATKQLTNIQSERVVFETENYATGMYFISINTGNAIQTKRFTVIR